MFGIMSDKTLILRTGEVPIQLPVHPHFAQVGDYLELARDYRLKQLWITKGNYIWKKLKKDFESHSKFLERSDHFTEEEKAGIVPMFFRSKVWQVRPQTYSNVLTAWDNTGHRCQLIFPGLTKNGWSFDADLDPFELFNAIDLFVEHIGVLPSYPIRTARTLFDKVGPELIPMGGTNSENVLAYYEPFLEPESDFLFLRPEYKAERSRPLAVAFDKRSMYLSALSEKMFSIYDYQETGPLDPKGPGDVWPGVYDCRVTFPNGSFLKKLIRPRGHYYSNFIKLFLELGARVEIINGWGWPPHRTERVFGQFYKTVSAAKKATEGGELASELTANKAVKRLYTDFVGWLRSIKHAEGWASAYYRPDYQGLIVSLANANLLRNILETEKKTGLRPLGIYHDELIYLVNDPSDLAGTPITDPARYSFEWECPADLVRAVIKDGGTIGAVVETGENYAEEIKQEATG